MNMLCAFGPFIPTLLLLNREVPIRPPVVVERLVAKSRSPMPVTNPGFLDLNSFGKSLNLQSITDADLSPPILPFPTKTKISVDIEPLGRVQPRSQRERWIRDRFEEIYCANKPLFLDLAPEKIRTRYLDDYDRLATVDPYQLELTFGSKLFDLIESEQEFVAVLCHELSHILLGHRVFSDDPPAWVESEPSYQAARRRADQLQEAIPIERLAELFSDLNKVQKLVRYEYDHFTPRGENEIRKIEGSISGGKLSKAQVEEIQSILQRFARNRDSVNCQWYVQLVEDEQGYQDSVALWQEAVDHKHRVIDSLMGEENAWANWREEQADVLGMRLYYQWCQATQQGGPEGFVNALVNTLKRREPDLPDYLNELLSARKDHWYDPPERSSHPHPSGKWRVWNALVQEPHLRYPQEYRALIESDETREEVSKP